MESERWKNIEKSLGLTFIIMGSTFFLDSTMTKSYVFRENLVRKAEGNNNILEVPYRFNSHGVTGLVLTLAGGYNLFRRE